MSETTVTEPPIDQAEQNKRTQTWAIKNKADYGKAAGEVRDTFFQEMDESSASAFSWATTEILVDELKHGWDLEEAINEPNWQLPSDADPVHVQTKVLPEKMEVLISSNGTITPRVIIEQYFTISKPRAINGNTDAVFVCTPKPMSEFPPMVFDEENPPQNGYGYLATAGELNQPNDRLEVIVHKTDLTESLTWPEDKHIPHTMVIRGPKHRSNPEETFEHKAA